VQKHTSEKKRVLFRNLDGMIHFRRVPRRLVCTIADLRNISRPHSLDVGVLKRYRAQGRAAANHSPWLDSVQSRSLLARRCSRRVAGANATAKSAEPEKRGFRAADTARTDWIPVTARSGTLAGRTSEMSEPAGLVRSAIPPIPGNIIWQ
jgi:hypothetical protein